MKDQYGSQYVMDNFVNQSVAIALRGGRTATGKLVGVTEFGFLVTNLAGLLINAQHIQGAGAGVTNIHNEAQAFIPFSAIDALYTVGAVELARKSA